MRFVSTRVHGMIDWVMGPLLLVLPLLLKLDLDNPEAWLPMVLGFAMLVLTFFTDYELGIIRRIPMGAHLMIDMGTGALLALSPWLFGFSERIWLPHLLLGIVEIGTAMTTQLRPVSHSATRAQRRA
jgi:hypothetical protein